MTDTKKRRPTKKAPRTGRLPEAPRRLNPIERTNPMPTLVEDIRKILVEHHVHHENLSDLAIDIARIVHFSIPNGAMYDSSVKLAEFVSSMAYKPPGVDEKTIKRLRKTVKECGFDWSSLCTRADTVLSIAAGDRLRELDQLIFEANNDLIAIHEMQKKYAKMGGSNITGGNAIKTSLQKMDLEREQLITRFPELVDDEPREREDTDE